jgi:RimJ/RimL family protein N-acetyltransferase
MVERKSWSKGYGTEAISGLLERLFLNKNMHRVWLRVDQGNARAIKCYAKCGFVKEGMLREDHFAHGAWRSSCVMSIVVDEFKEGRR